VPVWKDILANLAPYPVNENGLMIGKDVPFAKSHRHFSHLFMIYPLAIMDSRGADQELAAKSVAHWLGMTGLHTGYTYTGGASMAAYVGDGERALSLMNYFCDHYATPNTFYTEIIGWPVIETPLSGAKTLQDMVLQSWGGTIRVFPAVAATWQEVAFRDLRAEGAFLVSAVRAGGRTKWIKINSLAGEPCDAKFGMTNPSFRGLPESAITKKGDLYHLAIPKGASVVISENGEKDPDVSPVSRTGADNPWGSSNR
jgi:alpha-L-fucosidase 2